jgi:hypothetical protein
MFFGVKGVEIGSQPSNENWVSIKRGEFEALQDSEDVRFDCFEARVVRRECFLKQGIGLFEVLNNIPVRIPGVAKRDRGRNQDRVIDDEQRSLAVVLENKPVTAIVEGAK